MAQVVRVASEGRPYEVRWSVNDADGGRQHHKRRFRTRREADAHRRTVEGQRDAGVTPDYAGARESVAAWAERWYSATAPAARPSTARGYRSVLDCGVLAEFGSWRIGAVGAADVQDWVNGMVAAGLTPPTVRHRVTAARWVFAGAVRARALAHNPVTDVRLPTDRSVGRARPEPRFLTPEEIARVAGALDRAAPGAPWGLLVRFTAWTGLRAGEVAGLNVADVDLVTRTLHVRRTRERRAGEWRVSTPKSGKARRVPLVGWLAEDLERYLAEHPRADEGDAPLWPGGRPGGHSHGARGAVREGSSVTGAPDWDRPWEPGTFYRRRYLPAVVEAGLPTGRGGVNFHALRHTYASLCASAGVSSQQVAAWMGHANDVVTRTIYVHLFAEDTAAAVAALETAGRGGGRPRLALVPNESGEARSTRVPDVGRSLA